MKTKICNSCKELIQAEATKCPKCQSFQSKYRNPNFVSVLSLLLIPIFLLPFWWSIQQEKINYIDHKEAINLKVLRTDTIKRQGDKQLDLLNILIELENKTSIEWEQGEYEVEFRSTEGELLNIEKYGDFSLKLHPNSSAKSSVKIPLYQEYRHSTVKVNLINLRHNRY